MARFVPAVIIEQRGYSARRDPSARVTRLDTGWVEVHLEVFAAYALVAHEPHWRGREVARRFCRGEQFVGSDLVADRLFRVVVAGQRVGC